MNTDRSLVYNRTLIVAVGVTVVFAVTTITTPFDVTVATVKVVYVEPALVTAPPLVKCWNEEATVTSINVIVLPLITVSEY